MTDHPESGRRFSGGKAYATLALAGAVALALAGCGKSDGPAKDAPTQVAAKVDGTEISIHQINYVLARSKNNAANAGNAQDMQKQVLQKLIDQQLLVQKATEDKLDRTPDVQMALEAARREVLANAYLAQLTANKPTPDNAHVRQYYTDHPELFAQRRIYQLQELAYPAKTPPAVQASITAMVEAGKPLDEVAAALKSRGVEVARSDSQRAAEQISLELLPRLARLSPGQGLVTGNAQNVSVVYVKGFQTAPVNETNAQPVISQFLANQTLNQTVGDVVKSLRDKAKIEYVGEFAQNDSPPPQK